MLRARGLHGRVLPSQRHEHGHAVGAADRAEGKPTVGRDHGRNATHGGAGVRMGIRASARPGVAELRVAGGQPRRDGGERAPLPNQGRGRSSRISPTRSAIRATPGDSTTAIRSCARSVTRSSRRLATSGSTPSARTRASAPEAATPRPRTSPPRRATSPTSTSSSTTPASSAPGRPRAPTRGRPRSSGSTA